MPDPWIKLLTPARLRLSREAEPEDAGNDFVSDYSRVVYSTAFRRLQDKTQVYPVADNDFVRRRLTHSVEVATVGERMGRVIGRRLDLPHPDRVADQLGKIVGAACLLHDIGTPPFGHEGERAIQGWADSIAARTDTKTRVDSADLRNFDGNAQGFRIAVRLQGHGLDYGLNLTCATLAAYLKYPRVPPSPVGDKRGKISVFSSEQHVFDDVCMKTGITAGRRHPLCLLMEAADDITNRLIDIEDGIKTGLVDYQEVVQCFKEFAPDLHSELEKRWTQLAHLNLGQDDREQHAYHHLRAVAIGKMGKACEEAFVNDRRAIEAGDFTGNLIEKTTYQPLYRALLQLELERIFGSSGIVRVEAAGKVILRGLLDALYDAVRLDSKLASIVPVPHRFPQDPDGPDSDMHRVVDYVAGMTDGFAVRLYQQITGGLALAIMRHNSIDPRTRDVKEYLLRSCPTLTALITGLQLAGERWALVGGAARFCLARGRSPLRDIDICVDASVDTVASLAASIVTDPRKIARTSLGGFRIWGARSIDLWSVHDTPGIAKSAQATAFAAMVDATPLAYDAIAITSDGIVIDGGFTRSLLLQELWLKQPILVGHARLAQKAARTLTITGFGRDAELAALLCRFSQPVD